MIRTLLRVGVVPGALLAAVVATFAPALPDEHLWRAGAVSVAVAAALGALVAWRRFPPALAPVPVVAGVLGAAALAPPEPVRPTDIADTVATFLSVGLPAAGLPTLAVVVPLVVVPVGILTVVASVRRRPLLTLAGPVLGATVAAVLVAPTSVPMGPFAAIAGLAALVLVADARSDIAAMPPLVGTRTEERRQRSLWRPVVQIGGAVAVLLVAGLLPLPSSTHLRDLVHSDTIRVEDPNPLSVAARWGQIDAPEPIATVEVDGEVDPGRLRLSVLETYTATGWRQAADFAVTGERLAPDPLDVLRDAGPEGRELSEVHVVVDPAPALRPFRAVPTAGRPTALDDPAGMRFAPAAGMLLDTAGGRPVGYTTTAVPAPPTDPALLATVVPDVPARLLECPDIEAARTVADQLTVGLGSFEDRLGALEDWLLTRRIYDPAAPGGQTGASVASFLGTSFARGNLEVFVTSYALLARCAGVPVRVVVGVPSVAASDGSPITQDAVTAWVEVPVDGRGWVARDPLPTPEEQEQLARLAQQAPPPPEPAQDEEPLAQDVPPVDPDASDGAAWWLIAAAALLTALTLGAARAVPVWVRRRRRRTADPTAAVLAAWTTVLDALVDHGVPLAAAHTPQEVVDAVATHVPIPVRRAVDLLVPLVDAARYRGEPATEAEAGRAWALADLAILRLAHRGANRLVALRHPLRTARRVRSVLGTERVRTPWRAELPVEVTAVTEEAPDDIPGVSLDTRIGAGSTGTVFRGTVVETGEAVAVKVFRFGPGDDGFDERRFEWEIQIAEEVSGFPHLPEVHGAGTTPSLSRPYLITTLYEGGTLLDRIRRGGTMTTGEVVAIGADLATALATLHQLGVVHGDVKPENVFAGESGWILGDLGSAWLRAGRGPARSLTPPYAAPEVWRGSSPTPAADLYSLALTVLFAATGEVPVAGNPPDLEDVRARFPDHPDLVRALDPDPRRRPRSAGELAHRLRPEHLRSAAFVERGLSLPTPTVTTHQRT